MKKKTRLDLALVERGLVETRSKAQGLILAGQVRLNSQVENKAGRLVGNTDRLEVVTGLRYVSRGGLKLERALEAFHLSPKDWEIVDVGASTGGFTDCWLQYGAALVYAVDVGYGQLDWKLRSDSRVVVRERLNARYLTLDQLQRTDLVDAASIDASFIGLRLLLEPLVRVVRPGGSLVVLIKPQFEAGPERLGKGGVVRDPAVHRDVLERFLRHARELGYGVQDLIPSPIRGPEGNIEFLSWLVVQETSSQSIDVSAIVHQAWQEGVSMNG